jgi:hypothetical protein
MYIQSICSVYTKNKITYSIDILGIWIVYTIDIQCIYAVYTKYILSLYNIVYTTNIPGTSIYLWFHHFSGLCMVYTWYIHGILFQSYVDVIHVEGIYVVKQFWVWSVNDIPLIFHEYSIDIQIISNVYHYKKGTDLEMLYYVYALHMYDI